MYFNVNKTDAEIDNIEVEWTVLVWDENGTEIMSKNHTKTFTANQGFGGHLQPTGTHITCAIQIKKWKITKISAAK